MKPRLDRFELDGWEGTLQCPGPQGPRPSAIRTTSLVADRVTAYILAYTFRGLVSAGGAFRCQPRGGEEATVQIAGMQVAEAVETRQGAKLVVDWTMVRIA